MILNNFIRRGFVIRGRVGKNDNMMRNNANAIARQKKANTLCENFQGKSVDCNMIHG